MSFIKEDETLDDLQLKGIQVIQKKDAYRFGIDAVLLSDFAKAKMGDKVIDLGTGTGIIPILMEARYPEANQYIGLEIQKESAEMAMRSVALNGLEKK